VTMSATMPPPVGPRGLAIRVAEQGRTAYASGANLLACPYGPARPFSRRAWLAGYAAAARAAGAPLPGTEELEELIDPDAPWPADTLD